MRLWKSLVCRIAHFWKRSSFDADLAAELEFHFESRLEALERAGLSHAEAMRQARREFGSRVRTSEDVRQAWRFSWLEHLIANLRYGFRQARRNPAFAGIVILTLGLGIGANSAVFSAIDAVLLKPLAFPDGDRLMRLHQTNPNSPLSLTAPARLADWDRMNHTFQAL